MRVCEYGKCWRLSPYILSTKSFDCLAASWSVRFQFKTTHIICITCRHKRTHTHSLMILAYVFRSCFGSIECRSNRPGMWITMWNSWNFNVNFIVFVRGVACDAKSNMHTYSIRCDPTAIYKIYLHRSTSMSSGDMHSFQCSSFTVLCHLWKFNWIRLWFRNHSFARSLACSALFSERLANIQFKLRIYFRNLFSFNFRSNRWICVIIRI